MGRISFDNYGNIVHLGERDCTIQRRHQKRIEETPSIAVNDELRKKWARLQLMALKRQAIPAPVL